MRLFFSALLLLAQSGPFAGAAICLHAAAQEKAECSMPMPGMTHEGDRSHSSPSQDCAHMVVCAPTAPVLGQVPIQLSGTTQPSSSSYSTPVSLFPSDPIAPPQPPPIV